MAGQVYLCGVSGIILLAVVLADNSCAKIIMLIKAIYTAFIYCVVRDYDKHLEANNTNFQVSFGVVFRIYFYVK